MTARNHILSAPVTLRCFTPLLLPTSPSRRSLPIAFDLARFYLLWGEISDLDATQELFLGIRKR
jgi:hypothetical protein